MSLCADVSLGLGPQRHSCLLSPNIFLPVKRWRIISRHVSLLAREGTNRRFLQKTHQGPRLVSTLVNRCLAGSRSLWAPRHTGLEAARTVVPRPSSLNYHLLLQIHCRCSYLHYLSCCCCCFWSYCYSRVYVACLFSFSTTFQFFSCLYM